MHHHSRSSAIPWLAALFAVFLCPALAKSPTQGKVKHQIRIICASSMNENQEVILATTKDGKNFHTLAKLTLKASAITEWLPVTTGELHLAVNDGTALKSICSFTHPEASTKGLVFLVADTEAKDYTAYFVDPKEANFVKGNFLVFNFSNKPASVFLGSNEEKIAAEQHLVVKPTREGNGMFRLQVTRLNKEDKIEVCYDRYIASNQDSREMLFLLPDKVSGLNVSSISLFADLE